MSTVTQALIHYWLRLPARPADSRRRCLEAAIGRVRAGADRRDALTPYAIGDVDDEIVAAATREYVDAPGTAPGERLAALQDAVEWIRRSLALNRGAVFGALLALEDESVVERLTPLRLVLSAGEVATACRNLAPRPGGPLAGFLLDWLQLLEDGTLQTQRQSVGAALAARRAQAA